MNIIMKKKTIDYPSHLLNIVHTMSFNKNNTIIAGSSSLSNILYPNDVDCLEIITKSKNVLTKFQTIINNLMNINQCYIGDIKCGSIKEYDLFDGVNIVDDEIKGFDLKKSQMCASLLLDKHMITNTEYNELIKQLSNMNLRTYFNIVSKYKFNVLKWSLDEVKDGYMDYYDKRYYFNDVYLTGLFKLDVIAYIASKYIEFSCIYTLKIPKNENLSIKTDMYKYYYEGDYFKVCKRIYSYLGVKNKNNNIFMDLFNSITGLIYNVRSDINTLIYFLENKKHIPKTILEQVKNEVDLFKLKISNIFSISKSINKEQQIMKLITKFQSHLTNDKLVDILDQIIAILNPILNKQTLIFMKKNNIDLEYIHEL